MIRRFIDAFDVFFYRLLQESNSKRKGQLFEEHLVDWIFTREYYDLLNLTQDSYANFFRYVKSSEYPDFKFQDRIGGKKFWVEAKYRTAWLGDFPDQYIYFLTESQLERYKEVDKKLPVFIAVGTGNKAHNPNPVSYTHLTLPTTPYV